MAEEMAMVEVARGWEGGGMFRREDVKMGGRDGRREGEIGRTGRGRRSGKRERE